MATSPSIIALVIDMRGEVGLIREALQYWFEFINNHSTEGRFESHLVILSSHTDCLSSGETKQKAQFLQLITSHHALENVSLVGQVMLDCRYAALSSISQLRSIFTQSYKELRSSETMAIAHRCFLVFLFDQYRDQPAVRFSIAATDIASCIHLERYAYLHCLKSSKLIEVCKMLNKRGDILFMKNNECPENSWIVFDKSILLSQVNGVIFAPDRFKEHQDISTTTGVVPLSTLASLFLNLDHNMICQSYAT